MSWGRRSGMAWSAALAATTVLWTAFAEEGSTKGGGDPSGASPEAASEASPVSALLVVQNTSNVDLAFDFAQDGKRVPGCFWVLQGRSTTFSLPEGKTRWSYAVSAMQLVGNVQLTAKQPKLLTCKAWKNSYGDDDAQCTLAVPPDSLPAQDSLEALATSTLGFLTELTGALEKRDKKALGPLLAFPMDVEWSGKQKGKKRVKSTAQLVAQRKRLALDAKVLADARAVGGKLRAGADACDKGEIDRTRGDEALSCTGREVVVSLRATPACSEHQHTDTWKLENRGSAWRLAGKGYVEQKP